MKHIKILVVTALLFSEFVFCKPSDKANQNKQSEDKKVVFLKMVCTPGAECLMPDTEVTTMLA